MNCVLPCVSILIFHSDTAHNGITTSIPHGESSLFGYAGRVSRRCFKLHNAACSVVLPALLAAEGAMLQWQFISRCDNRASWCTVVGGVIISVVPELNYGTFVPTYVRSWERISLPGTFAPWNFHSLELSSPGTFAPESENDVELSLPNTNYQWFIQTLRRPSTKFSTTDW